VTTTVPFYFVACSPSADATAYAASSIPRSGYGRDPATGSAAGPLAGQLVAQGVAADRATIVVAQGHALGRPSQIRVEVAGQSVRVGGAGIVVAEGALHV
jgi:trans-2,3-dihydro-3-hydroxyanthranilate isomerase